MILRLTANAAVHALGGVLMGVTGVLAACTVAQAAARGLKRPAQSPGSAMPNSSGSGDGAD